jgi:hypothetical protein
MRDCETVVASTLLVPLIFVQKIVELMVPPLLPLEVPVVYGRGQVPTSEGYVLGHVAVDTQVQVVVPVLQHFAPANAG